MLCLFFFIRMSGGYNNRHIMSCVFISVVEIYISVLKGGLIEEGGFYIINIKMNVVGINVIFWLK